MNCPLCESQGYSYHTHKKHHYYRCSGCHSVFMHPDHRLSPEDERRRYEQHNNDVHDPRYQRFVAPVVNKVTSSFTPDNKGLDFGAGTGPVIAKMLGDQGYRVELYDPFFHDNRYVLDQRYDFIICCEVMEHFFYPRKSFALLRSLLNQQGSLICRTTLFTDKTDFPSWHYKNDETHTFCYHPDAVAWIAQYFDFARTVITDNTIIEFSLKE